MKENSVYSKLLIIGLKSAEVPTISPFSCFEKSYLKICEQFWNKTLSTTGIGLLIFSVLKFDSNLANFTKLVTERSNSSFC